MSLIYNWRDVLKKAWSVRLMLLSAFFSGVEFVLPYFSESFPRGIFILGSFLAVVAGSISRFIAQKGLSE